MYLVEYQVGKQSVLLQGYPQELLPITVPGIPSMHICLDFIPELLSQPSLEKQVFAMDLVSHLAVQYALPKSLSVARLAINTLSTLLGGKFMKLSVSFRIVQRPFAVRPLRAQHL
jgi:integrator complex subunit 2